MNAGSGSHRGRSLLAVFAHPDDESLACGGLLAWCAHQGARVSLVCATRGAGRAPVDATTAERERLGEVRIRELHEAAEVLGISDVLILDYRDGFLPWADAGRLEAEIGGAIRRFRPDVVVTFGEDGLYWHPDHIAIHQRTTAAAESLRDVTPALYYVTMPPGMIRQVVNWYLESFRESAGAHPVQMFGVTSIDAFGVLARAPTLVADVTAFAPTKLAALRCHRSQLANSALAAMTDTEAVRFFATEHFHRAAINPDADAFIEQLAARR